LLTTSGSPANLRNFFRPAAFLGSFGSACSNLLVTRPPPPFGRGPHCPTGKRPGDAPGPFDSLGSIFGGLSFRSSSFFLLRKKKRGGGHFGASATSKGLVTRQRVGPPVPQDSWGRGKNVWVPGGGNLKIFFPKGRSLKKPFWRGDFPRLGNEQGPRLQGISVGPIHGGGHRGFEGRGP